MMVRRDFLRGSALCAAGLAAAPAVALAAGADRAGAMALGESFVFPEWLAAMEAAVRASRNPGDHAFWRAFTDGRAGAGQGDRAVLTSLPAPGVELFAPDQARRMAALANDRLAERVAADRGRTAGLATLAATDAGAAREAERAIGKLGLSGLSLGANRGLALDDPRLWPVYAFAQAAGVPVYLPAAYAPVAGDAPYRASGAPGVLAGAAAESARHAYQLIFGGVLDAFPGLDIILARLGEGTPYWRSELLATYAVLDDAGARLPGRTVETYFATNIRLTTADMRSRETFDYCAACVGGDRMLPAEAASTKERARLSPSPQVRRMIGAGENSTKPIAATVSL